MVHYFIGNLGHLLIIVAFITALISAYSFYKTQVTSSKVWLRYAMASFYVHAVSVVAILIVLFLIINRHYFEYHYAWNYSSRYLPVYYQISSFWNGQEGSFLLWIFWNVCLGVVLLKTNRFWRPSIMTVMSVTQVFLTSMVLGVVFLGTRYGSSPFLLLRDVIPDSIFTVNPEFIPEDGNGLNPLLQNYWMVIHPPTLFLGFASTVVPFMYAIAGLWLGKYKEWIRPALPWTQFAVLILGIGILMGAYWAYETLNFGGYWNWDPVENAIYVPWLTLVAAMHTMIAYKKSGTALKASFSLAIATFILILYSTFLTRSGVLGETSVHSFTDLGLSGQLLVYLIVFLILSIALLAYSWNRIPSTGEETSTYSREFWIFLGATVLCLMAFQVIIPTSIPVYNEIVSLFGGSSNLAPPSDQVEFYSRFQLWFAIALAVLSGTGQFFWWNKMDPKKLMDQLKLPIMIALALSAVTFLLLKIQDFDYILLLTASVYSIVANAGILARLKRTNLKLSGGSITHIGVAMMLIGILFSSGYSKILSKNYTGLVWSNEFPDEVNQNNLLLFLNEPRQMENYSMVYKGMRKKVRDLGMVAAENLIPTSDPLTMVVTEEITVNGNTKALPGDSVKLINSENSYFEVEYEKASGKKFTLFPRVQLNESMGVVYSPDINRTVTADLYTHVRTFPDPEQEREWSDLQVEEVIVGSRFFVNDYAATFTKMVPVDNVPNVLLGPNDVAVKAVIEIEGESQVYTAEPIYLIKNQMAGKIPYVINDLAVQLTIESINPQNNSFSFGIRTSQKDWIILEAVEKPGINILWLGTLLLSIGLGIAIYRRYDEFMKMRDRALES